MNSSPSIRPIARESLEHRLQRVIDAHFDPRGGSAFWLDRAARLGIDARRIVRGVPDLALLGEMTPADLASRPLVDFIPRRFHNRLDRFIVGQTGGTTAMSSAGERIGNFGPWSAFREDEFDEAFVLPFVEAAAHVSFPPHESWLFVGPTGPHIIGKVIARLAASLGSHDPFSVDFDPRWAKRLADGSFARDRYLNHVIEQAMAVITTQNIGVLFTTPPVLAAMAAAMTPLQRQRIAGIHYGGLPVTPQQMARFQTEWFPRAVHLSGYGNTLLGCCLELNVAPGRQLDYFPMGDRLLLEVVDDAGRAMPAGSTGQVRVTRLDESMLIVRMRERDFGELILPPAGAPAEFHLPGIRNPGPPPSVALRPVATGLY